MPERMKQNLFAPTHLPPIQAPLKLNEDPFMLPRLVGSHLPTS